MLWCLLILLLICGVLGLIAEYIPDRYHPLLLSVIIVLLTFISCIRPGSAVSDYDTYEKCFSRYDHDILLTQNMESSFLWLSALVYEHGGTFRWLLCIYAILAIPLKLVGFSKLTEYSATYLAIAVYIGNFYMLHDCEQIRIGLGMAFSTWAIVERIKGRWPIAIALCFVGMFFHTTAILLVLPILLAPTELTRQWRWAMVAVVVIGVALYTLKFSIIRTLPIDYVEKRMILYESGIAAGEHPDVKVIQPLLLLRMTLWGFLLYNYDLIRPHLKALPILLCCQTISIFCWFALSDISVFAVRFSELFGYVEVLLFSTLMYTVTPRWAGKLATIGIALIFFGLNFMYNQFGFR